MAVFGELRLSVEEKLDQAIVDGISYLILEGFRPKKRVAINAVP